jgi:hypothetical protein
VALSLRSGRTKIHPAHLHRRLGRDQPPQTGTAADPP